MVERVEREMMGRREREMVETGESELVERERERERKGGERWWRGRGRYGGEEERERARWCRGRENVCPNILYIEWCVHCLTILKCLCSADTFNSCYKIQAH